MNRQDVIRSGNFDIRKLIAASEVGYPDTIVDLEKFLCTFNYDVIFGFLAYINRLLQLRVNLFDTENLLRNAFCSPILLNEIDIRNVTGSCIFNRESTLRLFTKSSLHCVPNSENDANIVDSKNTIARCFLIANEFISSNSVTVQQSSTNDSEMDLERRIKSLIIWVIPCFENSIDTFPSRSSGEIIVRSYELLSLLEEANSNIEVNNVFKNTTGLTLKEFFHLILILVGTNIFPEPDAILKGEGLFIDPKSNSDLTPLYEKLLPHVCISIDDIPEELRKTSINGNEFRLWRNYPLVKVSENRIICVDIAFLMDKVQTGIYWIILKQLNKINRERSNEFMSLWGDVFEDYASSILKRAINSQTPSLESCIISPKYIGKGDNQCTDVMVYSEETLILLECKATILTSNAKFSGDFSKLQRELKEKVIEGKESNKPKGIKQLCNAIFSLLHSDETKRKSVEGIDISKIKRVYPVLVFLDRVFSAPLMNWLLNSEFEGMLENYDLMKNVEIMKLTVLTVDNLEQLEPFLNDIPFHVHLDKWLTSFKQDCRLAFKAHTLFLHNEESRENPFMKQRFEDIKTEYFEYLSSQDVNLTAN